MRTDEFEEDINEIFNVNNENDELMNALIECKNKNSFNIHFFCYIFCISCVNNSYS